MVNLKVAIAIAAVAIVILASAMWYHHNVSPIVMPLVVSTSAPTATPVPMPIPGSVSTVPVGYMAATAAPMAALDAGPTHDVLVASVAPMSM